MTMEMDKTEQADGPPIVEGKVWKGDLPPLLPEWATDPALLRARAEIRAYRAMHLAQFHAIRTPLYAARVVVRGVIGTARGIATLVRWITHGESTPLRYKAVADGDLKGYMLLHTIRGEHLKVRMAVTGCIGAGAGIAVAVQAYTMPDLLWVEGVLAWSVAVWNGRGEDDPGVLDEVEYPQRLDLNVEDINAAFRAVNLLKGDDEDEDAPRLIMLRAPMYNPHARAWSCVARLPKGSGKTATEVIKKHEALAAELDVEMIQLVLTKVRGTGGTAGTFELTRFDIDPYLREQVQRSPLEEATEWSVWDAVPFGLDALGNRIYLPLIWENTYFGGLMRRGKTGAQRIPAAAAILDVRVRIWLADGKGGADWKAVRKVAHRYVAGAEPEALRALEAMLDEAIGEMERAYKLMQSIPDDLIRDGKITQKVCELYDLQPHLLVIDEEQEFLGAITDRRRRDDLVERIARIKRRGPAVGWFVLEASQRPDAKSVPAKLRDISSQRYCTQVADKTSSDMVLGDNKASQGADASILSEEHKGVGVLVLGPTNHVIVMVDYMQLPEFAAVCERGRQMRIKAGTLTGDATDDVLSGQRDETMPQVLADCISIMRHADRMHTTDLLNRLVNWAPEMYDTWDPDKLSAELTKAGVRRSTTQVKIKGINLNGYLLADLQAAAARFQVSA